MHCEPRYPPTSAKCEPHRRLTSANSPCSLVGFSNKCSKPSRSHGSSTAARRAWLAQRPLVERHSHDQASCASLCAELGLPKGAQDTPKRAKASTMRRSASGRNQPSTTLCQARGNSTLRIVAVPCLWRGPRCATSGVGQTRLAKLGQPLHIRRAALYRSASTSPGGSRSRPRST